jgi:hypothetical protein
LEKGQLADGHTVIASLKPLGQLETTLVGMFIGWSSETVMFFCCCCLERYKRNNQFLLFGPVKFTSVQCLPTLHTVNLKKEKIALPIRGEDSHLGFLFTYRLSSSVIFYILAFFSETTGAIGTNLVGMFIVGSSTKITVTSVKESN